MQNQKTKQQINKKGLPQILWPWLVAKLDSLDKNLFGDIKKLNKFSIKFLKEIGNKSNK